MTKPEHAELDKLVEKNERTLEENRRFDELIDQLILEEFQVKTFGLFVKEMYLGDPDE